MKALRLILPHMTVSLALALTAVTIADSFNPAMRFLSSAPGRTLIYLTAISALLTSLISVVEHLSGSSRQAHADVDDRLERYGCDGSRQKQEDAEDIF